MTLKHANTRWGEKRYYSLDYYLKQTYHEKIYRLALNGNMTCPNRDGTLGTNGCIFCSRGGSGDFAAPKELSIQEQIQEAKMRLSSRIHCSRYIAYFQAFTNTYAPVDYLRRIFTEAIMQPDIAVLSIATRPDCLDSDVLSLLDELNHIKPVWVELGLQTIHEDTASFIRRGYPLSTFDTAVQNLRALGIDVIVHLILGLPGEDISRILQSVDYISQMPIQGVKLQLLHILADTDLADYYQTHPFYLPDCDDYCHLVIHCLEHLSPDLVVHRLTGDGPSEQLIAPLWSKKKMQVLNRINQLLKEYDTYQGRYFHQS
ncbi:MAG: TIGR01212 family radical SAM protein [Lachnospiraceae bacterium]